jgi:hypothetical protein
MRGAPGLGELEVSLMPYRSEKQRRFMHARHPDIAARWDEEYGGKIVPKKKSPPGARKAVKRRAARKA